MKWELFKISISSPLQPMVDNCNFVEILFFITITIDFLFFKSSLFMSKNLTNTTINRYQPLLIIVCFNEIKHFDTFWLKRGTLKKYSSLYQKCIPQFISFIILSVFKLFIHNNRNKSIKLRRGLSQVYLWLALSRVEAWISKLISQVILFHITC